MKAVAKYSFMFIALTATAFAEKAAHHEPSVKELMYPAINFFVLVAFLVWKLKKPMTEMFNKKANDVQSLMTSAAQKNKDYENDVVGFNETQNAETQSVITRTKKDLEHKLDGEKNELVENLNEDLLNSVIAKTQQTINASSDMKNRATTKIVSELR
jgi:F0F1-type ATP synthase membrane subunit b/b'